MHIADYEEPARPKAFCVGKWLDKLNNAFTFEEDRRFIDDNQFQISREDSKKRILNMMIALAGFLLFSAMMMLWPIVAYHNFKELQTPNTIKSKCLASLLPIITINCIYGISGRTQIRAALK